MQPKTKEQKMLAEVVNNHLRPLTQKELQYAKRHTFTPYAIESRGRMMCSQCGHSWRPTKAAELDKITCPRCKKKLGHVHHNHTKGTDCEYFVLAENVNDTHQLFRFYWMERTVQFGKDVQIKTPALVGLVFIRVKDGKQTNFLRSHYTMYGCFRWLFNSPIELKSNSSLVGGSYYGYYGYEMFSEPAGTMITRSINPTLSRNGWELDESAEWSECVEWRNNHPHKMAKLLLSDNDFESSFKLGQYAVCEAMMTDRERRCSKDVKKTLLKLANRHHHIFKSVDEYGDYVDYADDLEFIGRDYHNPAILFPKNFHAEKMRVNALAVRKREQERAIEQAKAEKARIERDKYKAMWQNHYTQAFYGMVLSYDDFDIKPLVQYEEFNAEGNAMHHCIRTYYGKVDTLLLSITRNGERAETAEINLKTLNIVQCRGVCNHPSEWHDKIVELLEKSMPIFKERNKKKTATLPAVIVKTPWALNNKTA